MNKDFIYDLPKIELHAHLNGSLKADSILELGHILNDNADDLAALTSNFISFNKADHLDACFQKFKFMHDLTSTKDGLSKATQMVIRDFVADNVIYLELRTTPKANANMTSEDYLNIVLHAIETAEEVKSKSIIVKLLPSIDRSKPIEQATETLRIVKKLRAQSEQYANLITGIDWSGYPHCGTFEEFKLLLKEARQNGLKLALHCAEIDSPSETKAMLEFGMERCGHGTFLNDAQLVELYKRNIAIECCLTSNIKCQTVLRYEDHHFKRIFQHEKSNNCSKHLVLCTDDSGVFDTTLSEELVVAAKHFELTQSDLVQLQLNAIEHSFANMFEKSQLREKILKYSRAQNVK